MVKTNLSSKGQVTIPLSFRKRMNLVATQTVELNQLADGAVVLRPVPSILALAGSLKPAQRILSSKEERKRARELMARRSSKP
jgi:AbrB family looped-hinge helix DNA binding protein